MFWKEQEKSIESTKDSDSDLEIIECDNEIVECDPLGVPSDEEFKTNISIQGSTKLSKYIESKLETLENDTSASSNKIKDNAVEDEVLDKQNTQSMHGKMC